jgi:hypothetical protein
MSDGREEREEQEERRKWEKERKDRDDDLDRDWERDGDRERRDSRAVEALDAAVRAESTFRTRRSFVIAAAAAAGGYGFYRWLDRSPMSMRLQEPMRHMLRFNAKLSRAIFNERGLAPTYPMGKSMELRANGNYGLKMDLVPESYRLQMVGVENAKDLPQYAEDVTAWEYQYEAKKEAGPVEHDTKVRPKSEPMGTEDAAAKADPNGDAGAGLGPMMMGGPASTMVGSSAKGKAPKISPELEAAMKKMKRRPRGQEEAGMSRSTLMPGTPGLLLKMEDVTSLPHHELVTEFKCIEGWSQVVHWGGYRLADLIAKYPPEKKADGSLPKYVYMETPDGDYYCGYSLQACMHPQSLLATEMAGRPLAQWHGAPMRLHMPIKYGYKQIKRIGLIAYTDMQPDDYWTKLGYDWYAGL